MNVFRPNWLHQSLNAGNDNLLQDLEKRDAQAEKKRESIMVNFNQTKGQLSSMEYTMKSLQVDLEKTQFALEVKKGRSPVPLHNENCALNLHNSPCELYLPALQPCLSLIRACSRHAEL